MKHLASGGQAGFSAVKIREQQSTSCIGMWITFMVLRPRVDENKSSKFYRDKLSSKVGDGCECGKPSEVRTPVKDET